VPVNWLLLSKFYLNLCIQPSVSDGFFWQNSQRVCKRE